jgi:hypothetical protein
MVAESTEKRDEMRGGATHLDERGLGGWWRAPVADLVEWSLGHDRWGTSWDGGEYDYGSSRLDVLILMRSLLTTYGTTYGVGGVYTASRKMTRRDEDAVIRRHGGMMEERKVRQGSANSNLAQKSGDRNQPVCVRILAGHPPWPGVHPQRWNPVQIWLSWIGLRSIHTLFKHDNCTACRLEDTY